MVVTSAYYTSQYLYAMKFDTILYCKGIDALISLSWALSGIPFAKDSDDENPPSTSIRDNKTVQQGIS